MVSGRTKGHLFPPFLERFLTQSSGVERVSQGRSSLGCYTFNLLLL